MTHCKPSPIPLDPGFVSGLARIDSPPLTCVTKDIYPSPLINLQYAVVCTRLDVSITLSILGSAHAHPTEVHLQALKKVVRYLKGTIHQSLTLRGRTNLSLQFTSPTNDNCTRKSRSGYLFTLGRGPITYKSKQQTCVAQSTCEAEYYSVADATKEGIHLRQLIMEIFNAPITGTNTI
jgi:hypothetical protein